MEIDKALALITQLGTLASDIKKGVADRKVPKGVIPASQGSSFKEDTDISPTLTPNETRRIKQIALIFRDVFKPHDEAGRIKVDKTPSKSTVERDASVGFIGKSLSDIIFGVLSGVGRGLSSIGTFGSAFGAAVLGVAGLAMVPLAWGILKLTEALLKMQGLDWSTLQKAGVIFGTLIGAIALAGVAVDSVIGGITLLAGMGAVALLGPVMASLGWGLGKLADGIKPFGDIDNATLTKVGIAFGVIVGIVSAFAAVTEASGGTGFLAILAGLAAVALLGPTMAALGWGFGKLAEGMTQLEVGISAFDTTSWDSITKSMTAFILAMAPLAVAGALTPLIMLGSIVTDFASGSLEKVASAFNGLAPSMIEVAKAVMIYETIDAAKLRAVGGGIIAISGALGAFSASNFVSGVVNAFSSIFSGDPFEKFMQIANRSDALKAGASAITELKNAFAEFVSLRTNDLAYNLANVADAVDRLDIGKLKKIYQSPEFQDSNGVITELRQIRGGLLYGVGDSEGGLVQTTKKILTEDKKQVQLLTDIRTILTDIRLKMYVNPNVSPEQARAVGDQVQSLLRPENNNLGLTLQSLFGK